VDTTLPAEKERVLDLGNNVSMKLVLIPPGKFLMGCRPNELDRRNNERPPHEVRITRPFYMGACEVTQAQYQQVMGVNPSTFMGSRTPEYNRIRGGGPLVDLQKPVETLSWDDAVEFCRKAGAGTGEAIRLPTEAQWEYACRAGTTTPFHTGETISAEQANYDTMGVYGDGQRGRSRDKTLAVGSFAPNAFGLHDMHGNVHEWCSDRFAPDYSRAAGRDPQGPASGKRRVVRGGSWGDPPQDCRSARRFSFEPESRGRQTGFRVVVEVR
jgi:formylglycine-generating enzyme required for sulfatase activity